MTSTTPNTTSPHSAVLHRSLKSSPLTVTSAHKHTLNFSDGSSMLDSTCGAAVSCIGYGSTRVRDAMMAQLDKVAYVNSMFFSTPIYEELAAEIISGTEGKMARALIMGSGSEAMEAALKMARQYFVEVGQLKRSKFIARESSYHGTTLGSLGVSGHVGRRALFEGTGMLGANVGRVSPCYAYRGMKEGMTEADYVKVLADELDRKFQEMGPESVCAFIAEPVVGAALGCVPAVPGYFKAMKAVCEKHGALLILDEVMSGMGRCGTLHEWQQEGIVPDIQTMAKGLGGGYVPVAGILINHKVADALSAGTGAFAHGHTYQGHPVTCAGALEVQRIIREENLVANVARLGVLLGDLLHQTLDSHPYVGDVRGKGLFWGLEFVTDKRTKEPFPRAKNVANAVHAVGLHKFGISLYPGMGTKDGIAGDHVLICPAYNSSEADIRNIVARVKQTVEYTFKGLEQGDEALLRAQPASKL